MKQKQSKRPMVKTIYELNKFETHIVQSSIKALLNHLQKEEILLSKPKISNVHFEISDGLEIVKLATQEIRKAKCLIVRVNINDRLFRISSYWEQGQYFRLNRLWRLAKHWQPKTVYHYGATLYSVSYVKEDEVSQTTDKAKEKMKIIPKLNKQQCQSFNALKLLSCYLREKAKNKTLLMQKLL